MPSFCPLAQWLAQLTVNQLVLGSNPRGAAIQIGVLMYLVDIYDTKSGCAVGPNYWTTPDGEITLKKAIQLAEDWVASSKEPSRYKVSWRVVGCL